MGSTQAPLNKTSDKAWNAPERAMSPSQGAVRQVVFATSDLR